MKIAMCDEKYQILNENKEFAGLNIAKITTERLAAMCFKVRLNF